MRDSNARPLAPEAKYIPYPLIILLSLYLLYASYFRAFKVDLYTLQKLMTHKSADMTQRYAHLRDEALQKASEVTTDFYIQSDKKNDEE